jgi:hypothetical protein
MGNPQPRVKKPQLSLYNPPAEGLLDRELDPRLALSDGGVDVKVVEATLPHLPAPVAAMVRLQLLAGMGTEETLAMRTVGIIVRDKVWSYYPSRLVRLESDHLPEVLLGPKAQEVIRPFYDDTAPSEYIFRPARKTIPEGRNWREKIIPLTARLGKDGWLDDRGRSSSGRFGRYRYLEAIRRGCEEAFPAPDGEESADWLARHRWKPGQLRRTFIADVRALFGDEAVRAVLSRSRSKAEYEEACRIVKLIG